MKVLILTEGGRGIGFGHITRCISLYQAFREKGITPEIIVNGDWTIESLLKGKDYRIFSWLRNKKAAFGFMRNADVVIIDSYLANRDFYKRVSDLARVPVYIDDNNRLDYPRGIVVNANIYAKELKYQKKSVLIYLLGPKYAMLRREFWEIPEKEIRDKVKSFMITFGGNSISGKALKILRFLQKKYPEFKKNIVIGRGFNGIGENLKGKKTNLIFGASAESMRQLMLGSDIAISAGGQTLYELARVGLPTIALALRDNQLNNVRGWEKEGFIEYAGPCRAKELLFKLDKGINKFISHRERFKRSRIARSAVDGKGAYRIVEAITGKIINSKTKGRHNNVRI